MLLGLVQQFQRFNIASPSISHKFQMAKSKYYAVRIGRTPGIYKTWPEAEQMVKGYPGARHASFPTMEEAQRFMREGQNEVQPIQNVLNTVNSTIPGPQSSAATKHSRGNAPNTLTEVKRIVECYTDGACSGNGKTGAVAGIGVYFPEENIRISEPLLPRTKPQTNQRAELKAMIVALERNPYRRQPDIHLKLMTDSKYSIDCITKWIKKWRRNDFRTQDGDPVKNLDLIKPLSDLYQEMGHRLTIEHVRGHRNIRGNEIADELARMGARKVQQG